MRFIRGDAAVDVSILFGDQDVGLLETMVVGGARACRLVGPCAAPFAAGRAAPGGRAVAAAREMAVAAAQLPDPMLKFGIDNLPINGPDRFSVARDFMTMRRIGVM